MEVIESDLCTVPPPGKRGSKRLIYAIPVRLREVRSVKHAWPRCCRSLVWIAFRLVDDSVPQTPLDCESGICFLALLLHLFKSLDVSFGSGTWFQHLKVEEHGQAYESRELADAFCDTGRGMDRDRYPDVVRVLLFHSMVDEALLGHICAFHLESLGAVMVGRGTEIVQDASNKEEVVIAV